MKQFYSRLSLQWLELPAVTLAFGEDYRKPAGARVSMVKANIRSLHKVREIEDIEPMVFLNTLKTKGILHTLPTTLDRFKDERLLGKGPYGPRYKDLYRLGWFHNPKVAPIFAVEYQQDPDARTLQIKDAIYWNLGGGQHDTNTSKRLLRLNYSQRNPIHLASTSYSDCSRDSLCVIDLTLLSKLSLKRSRVVNSLI